MIYKVTINGNTMTCDNWSQVLDEISLPVEALGTVDRVEIVVETFPDEEGEE